MTAMKGSKSHAGCIEKPRHEERRAQRSARRTKQKEAPSKGRQARAVYSFPVISLLLQGVPHPFRQTSQSARSSFQSVMQALFSALAFLTMFMAMLTNSLIAHDPSGLPSGLLHPRIGSGLDLMSEPSARSESGGCTSISAF